MDKLIIDPQKLAEIRAAIDALDCSAWERKSCH
jgi:hypothetical protein